MSQPNAGRERAARPAANIDTLVALGVVALGVGIFVAIPSEIDEPPRLFGLEPTGLSPELFPSLVAGAFVAVGLVYAVASLRMGSTNPFAALPRGAWLNLGVVLAAMIGYVALLRPVGYVGASAAVAAIVSSYYGSRSVVGIALVSIGAPVAIYVLFTRVLGVSLPPTFGF
ncbi:tripartite tricarboxylate transporter TctB family protein [Salinarimonas ramus]|uniref:DUF1468 domain-containing protein n=1 Tax=Salinarimonas ramus TaxID=690164 RepID=A0A917V3T0_9HYPH|nr:tripartite tricarboxylate transporter TctB family protein [Salinarimonas ramus]GGK35666.1 hypothetical protein GCM10011322_23180 [Salinarimonas ramus]